MPALNFTNSSNTFKFTGNFTHNGKQYEYVLYLPPFAAFESEIVEYFGKRRVNMGGTDLICLGLHRGKIRANIKNQNVSAFIIVNESGNDEKASGTLQIYDWCSGLQHNNIPQSQVWINDLCRVESPTARAKTQAVNALMYFMEQLTVQNLQKPDINLFVDGSDSRNKDGLMKLYDTKYGFSENSEQPGSIICTGNTDKTSIAMKKSNLVADKSSIDFDFLTPAPAAAAAAAAAPASAGIPGGSSKRKSGKKRRSKKTRKTKKRRHFKNN